MGGSLDNTKNSPQPCWQCCLVRNRQNDTAGVYNCQISSIFDRCKLRLDFTSTKESQAQNGGRKRADTTNCHRQCIFPPPPPNNGTGCDIGVYGTKYSLFISSRKLCFHRNNTKLASTNHKLVVTGQYQSWHDESPSVEEICAMFKNKLLS